MAGETSKDIVEVDFDWLDSDTYVTDPSGNLVPAGTAIKLISQILFLSPLSEQQLKDLKSAVNSAVDHELSKRQS